MSYSRAQLAIQGKKSPAHLVALLARVSMLLLSLAALAVRPASANNFIHFPDLLPTARTSPLLATPEAAKLDAFTGSVGYQYPIIVPPGTGGATPTLVLSYSSLTKATEYGQGWSLGLGAIQRSTRHGPPTYTSTDAFELDGDLLVPDPRPASNRFHRERTQFEKIEFLPSASGGWWSVTQPDGTQLRYGSRDDGGANSRLSNPYEATADNNSATVDVFRWRLDEVVDPRGNAYRIDYEISCNDADGDCSCSQGELCPDVPPAPAHLYPKQIDYSFREAGTLGTKQASRRVAFAWEPRGYVGEDLDRPTSYRGGFQDRISRRLAGITTSVEGTQAARWAMAYSPKTTTAAPHNPPFSQLRSIQRYGRNDEAFSAPTSFSYSSPELKPDLQAPTNVLPTNAADVFCDGRLRDDTSISWGGLPFSMVALVDLNGDGLLDRLGNEASCSSATTWHVMFGRAPDAQNPARFEVKDDWNWYEAGGVSTVVPSDVIPHLGFLEDSTNNCGHWSEVQVVDIDGDGRSDLVDVRHELQDPQNPQSPEDRQSAVLDWTVRLSRGDGFGPPLPWSPPAHSIPEPYAGWYPMYGQTLGFIENCHTQYTDTWSRLLDVNGDGRPDHVARTDPSTWSIAINAGCDSSGSCGFDPAYTVSAPRDVVGSNQVDYSDYDEADVHGDGLPDYVSKTGECMLVRPSILHLGSYGAYGQSESSCGFSATRKLHEAFAMMRDVNGDGWLDRVDYVNFVDAQIVYLGLGDGRFSSQAISAHAFKGDEYSGGVDLDSDGLAEEVHHVSVNQWDAFFHDLPPGLLLEITNEFGGVTQIQYQNTATFAGTAALAASPEYQAESLSGTTIGGAVRHYWVVSQIDAFDGRVGTAVQSQSMTYAEPRYDWVRRENHGLRMAEVTTDGVTARSIFHQDQERKGRLQLQETVTPGGAAGVVHQGRALTWQVYQPVTEDSPETAPVPIPGSSFAAATEVKEWTSDPNGPSQPRQIRAVGREFGWEYQGTWYSKFGNLREQLDYGPDGDAGQTADNGLLTRYEYFPNDTKWLVNYPAQIEHLKADESTLLGRVRLLYDDNATHTAAPTYGLVTEQRRTADDGAGVLLTERFEYDTPTVGPTTIGNVTRYWDPNAVAAAAGPSAVVTYDDGLFNSRVTRATNAISQPTDYEIDPLDGSLLQQLDANNYLQCWAYDGFGRLTARSRHSAPQASVSSACDETLAEFEFETFEPGTCSTTTSQSCAIDESCPVGETCDYLTEQISPDKQHIRSVDWSEGVASPTPACDPSEPSCIESFRYFDGLGREYFAASESEKTTPMGTAGRFFRERNEWGPRGELTCGWLPARGPSNPTPYTPSYPGCSDPSQGSPLDRRVFAYDALLRMTSQKHGGNVERSVAYVVKNHDQDPAGTLEVVAQITVDAGSDPGDVDLYREVGRDRNGGVISVCEDPGATGNCDAAVFTRITRDEKQRVTRIDGPDIALDGGGSDDNAMVLVYDQADRRLQLVRPPDLAQPLIGPTWSWTYDANSNLRLATPPRGANGAVAYHYDAINRLRYKDLYPSPAYPNMPTAREAGDSELIYDEPGDTAAGFGLNAGLLTTELTDDLTRTHDWGLGGRTSRTSATFHVSGQNHTFVTTSEVDALGRPKTRTYPDGESLSFAFSGASHTSVVLGRYGGGTTTLLDGIQAHPSGGLEKITHAGPGISVTRDYPDSKAQRLGSLQAVGATGSIQDLIFDYDRAGNLECITNNAISSTICEQAFYYDGMHRLIQAIDTRDAGTQGGYGTMDYAYDSAGNMTRKGLNGMKYGGNGDLPDAVTAVYFNTYAAPSGDPTMEDPCPAYSGEEGTTDTSGDGIPDVCQCGDANDNGIIDVGDIQHINNNCIFEAGPCNLPKCDATGDGVCNSLDISAINNSFTHERYFEHKCSLRPSGKPVAEDIYTYAYDDDGRLESRDLGVGNVVGFNWDDEGRLTRLETSVSATYAYDASGQRIKKVAGGVTLLFVSPEFEVDLTNGTHSKHVFVMGQRALTIQQDGIGQVPGPAQGEQQVHLFADHLGSQRVATDGGGAVLQRAVVRPYGELHALLDGAGGPLSSSATPFIFTGHRMDGEANLHYMGARYYDPLAGGFLSTDPAWITVVDARLGASLSAYTYAEHRPTTVTDPTGTVPDWVLENMMHHAGMFWGAGPGSTCDWSGRCFGGVKRDTAHYGAGVDMMSLRWGFYNFDFGSSLHWRPSSTAVTVQPPSSPPPQGVPKITVTAQLPQSQFTQGGGNRPGLLMDQVLPRGAFVGAQLQRGAGALIAITAAQKPGTDPDAARSASLTLRIEERQPPNSNDPAAGLFGKFETIDVSVKPNQAAEKVFLNIEFRDVTINFTVRVWSGRARIQVHQLHSGDSL